jgi:pimeloyl-ACP methyl ester carboxylesterase
VITRSLGVPGATLHYEVRGSGPVVLLVPGGPAAAGVFANLAGELVSDHTVVTYDPRGLARSTLDGPVEDGRLVDVFADDVHRLLAEVTTERAFVFANSGGAVFALELATHHPEQVSVVVAHEPPVPALLPDSSRWRAAMEGVSATHRAHGVWPAMQDFMALAGGGPPPVAPSEPAARSPEKMPDGMAGMQSDLDFFLAHYLLAIARYEPDVAALKATTARIVPAVGEESAGQFAHEGGLALARLLGVDAVTFPGGHGGFESHARPFAERLRQVFAGR